MIRKEKINCCGCGACKCACPNDAIQLVKDENGFVYPFIDQTLCTGCGICDMICAYQSSNKQISLKDTFVAASIDTDPLESASGGIFASIAKNIISNGGVVYGCAMLYEDMELTPRHIRVTTEKDLILLKGSKYVQSEIGTSFKEVKDDLRDGVTVLFSGTPCQIAGLKAFLRKDYPNLFTIDIICHGVPSVQMFQDYLRYEEQKLKCKIVDFKFRDKSDGWKLQGKMIVEKDNGLRKEIVFSPEKSSYYQMFLDSYIYRENCYTCPYACDNRPGDITIGDYWCIDLVHPELLVQNGGCFDEAKGISCLVVNNEHGRELLALFGSGLMRAPSTFEQASRYNGQLLHPSQLKPERKIVMEKYARGYAVLDRWYRRKQLPIIVKRKIRAAIPKNVKNAIKKVMG